MNRDELMVEVLNFMADPHADFERLALAIFAWQRAHNAPYGRIAGDLDPRSVEEIPAIPVELFKSVPLTCFPPEQATHVFRTSGTTGALRGIHRLRDTRLYDAGCVAHFRACVAEAPERVVSLCPVEPDSSLGHMVRLFSPSPVELFSPAGVSPSAWDALRDGPVLLAATAFALDALLAIPGRAALDPGSVVMVTGGFKGRRVRLDSASLYSAISARLGAPRVVGEYGMTELSSQLWTDPVAAGATPGAFRAPPWMRVYTVDPATGAPCEGEGLLRFVDLCNLDSVIAIETLDLGVVRGPWVTLRGRLSGAEARGCSLRAEDFLSAARD